MVQVLGSRYLILQERNWVVVTNGCLEQALDQAHCEVPGCSNAVAQLASEAALLCASRWGGMRYVCGDRCSCGLTGDAAKP